MQTITAFKHKIEYLEKESHYCPYGYAIAAKIGLALMQLNLKIVASFLTPIYGLLLRAFFLLIIQTIIVTINQQTIHHTNSFVNILLIKRALCNFIALSMVYVSINYVPMGIANSLYNIGPLILYFVEAYMHKVCVPLFRNPLEKFTLSSLVYASPEFC